MSVASVRTASCGPKPSVVSSADHVRGRSVGHGLYAVSRVGKSALASSDGCGSRG